MWERKILNKELVVLLLKGIPIGISNILPGISGGTIALVLGIYEDIIDALKGMRMRVLLPIASGAVLGILVTASLISGLMEHCPAFMFALIFGLILASAVITIKDVNKFNYQTVFSLICGFFLAFAVSGNTVTVSSSSNLAMGKVVAAGVLGSVSMLLPGISGATMLVMIGMYQTMLQALTEFNLMIILVFSISALLGVVGLAWVLSYLLRSYRSILMAALSGLIIGSAFVVIPDKLGVTEALGIVSGIVIVLLLTRLGQIKSHE